ncbi:unnamed protein product [Aphanomyces euteiches]|uniref:Uncharacterized protein n=1 Tax=Aphanomyces euteiches TaxID=100861 RepID=A0A6G0XTH5_9STRA|nr:hypothetical protein Ae201684_001362 [Aphanomyces euteiches]KAH9075215.1 hypothetical protein Ae201684P_003898 [Aphanomyces euteiches]KAH9141036.1 hypothetical protein AeRB84_014764 [Aphanomyces euteiches]
MSLVANYSDSDSSEDEKEVKTVEKPCAKAPVALPSADDLFADNFKKPASVGAFTARQPAATPALPTQPVPKRSIDDAEIKNDVRKPVRRKVRSLVPPQLRRPNVSTEDLSAWNTQKTMKQQGAQQT